MLGNQIRTAMERAIELAKESNDCISLNKDPKKSHPPVGAVVLSEDSEIIGEGIHDHDPNDPSKCIWEDYNLPDSHHCVHAEFLAFRDAYLKHRDKPMHTLVTTLEPCSIRSSGVRLACSRTSAFLGIKEVYIGMLDPSYLVRGVGCQLLQTRGIFFNMFPQDLYNKLLTIGGIKDYITDRTKTFLNGEVKTEDVVRGIDRFSIAGSGLIPMGLSDKTLWQGVRAAHDLTLQILPASHPRFVMVVASFLKQWNYKNLLEKAILPLGEKSGITRPLRYPDWFGNLYEFIEGYLGLPKNGKNNEIEQEVLESIVRWWMTTV